MGASFNLMLFNHDFSSVLNKLQWDVVKQHSYVNAVTVGKLFLKKAYLVDQFL